MTSEDPREVTTLRRLHELMGRVNAGDDLASVLQTVVDGVSDVTGFDVAVVSYLHPDMILEVVAVAGDDRAREQLLGVRTPLEEFTAEFTIADEWGRLLRFIPHERLDGEAVGWIPDVAPLDVPDAWHPEDALFAILPAPTGETVGMLSVDLPRDGRRPEQFVREALEMYAVQAGIAISNAQQRERLREQVRLGGAVRQVAHTAGRALDLGHVIDSSVQPIAEGLHCHSLCLRAFEGEGEAPWLGRGAIYPPRGRVASEAAAAAARSIAYACWEQRRAVVLPESPVAPLTGVAPEQADLILEFVGQVGVRSVLFVPVGTGLECLGYLVLARDADGDDWTIDEVDAALEIGRDLGRSLLHARLYERERQVVEELQQLDRYKTEMISTLAHELKNPLTSIIGHLELLQTPSDVATTHMSLSAIKRGATRLYDLVEDLLLLSKVGDPHRPLVPAPVDIAEVVLGCAEMLGPHAAKQGVHLVLQGVDQPVITDGDVAELDRVVVNLLGNAVKFSTSGGTVTCRVETTPDELTLHFSDEGMGISEEDQARLFSEFFRSTNPEALRVPGTGLGLTIVARIVERHRGTISLDSELGRGSTFTVTVPRTFPDSAPRALRRTS